MNEPAAHEPRVRVLQRIEARVPGSVVTVDPGVFDALFLCEMLGRDAYMQAYTDGRLQVMHEG